MEAKAAVPTVQAIASSLYRKLYPLFELEELFNAGMLGLARAAVSFNPEIHPPWKIYSKLRIRWEILDSIRREAWQYATTRESIEAVDPGAQITDHSATGLGMLLNTNLLSAEEKKLLELIYVDDLSCRQISKQKIMSIGEKRAQKVHRKALDKLRSGLKEAA